MCESIIARVEGLVYGKIAQKEKNARKFYNLQAFQLLHNTILFTIHHNGY